jgi:hypothetical protein
MDTFKLSSALQAGLKAIGIDQVKWVLKRLLGGPRPEINEVAKELGHE